MSSQLPLLLWFLGLLALARERSPACWLTFCGFPHISIGALLRSHARADSEIGLRLRGMMAQGHLVPDTLVLDVLAARISEPDCARGLILDGFPRTLGQAELLEQRTIEIAILCQQSKGKVGCPSSSRAKQHNCGKTLRAPYLFSL